MKREYSSGTHDNVHFFVGKEVEKTPAYGLLTLFVVGLHRPETIEKYLKNNITHIFFGANHSFSLHNEVSNLVRWEEVIQYFLQKNYVCTLDIPITDVDLISKGSLFNYENFIPQIRISLPNIKKWPTNSMIKIDDVGFNETNPGVWCHNLENFLTDLEFTSWNDYLSDQIF